MAASDVETDAAGGVVLRALTAEDLPQAEALMTAELGGRRQRRLDEFVDALAGEVVVLARQTRIIALASLGPRIDDRRELMALAVRRHDQGHGHGGALLEAAVAIASRDRARALWLVTTNDNLDAMRLYQRHGFRLAKLRPGAVDRARHLKPDIPMVGAYGLPLRDELILVRTIVGEPDAGALSRAAQTVYPLHSV